MTVELILMGTDKCLPLYICKDNLQAAMNKEGCGLIAVAVPVLVMLMNYPAAELRGIKMNFYLINPDAEHRGILLIKSKSFFCPLFNLSFHVSSIMFTEIYK